MNAYEDKIKRLKWEKHSLSGVVDRQQRELDEYRRQMNDDHDEVTHPVPRTKPLTIDYRCYNWRFWLSSHDCQVPTPTSQNIEVEQQIWIFGAD